MWEALLNINSALTLVAFIVAAGVYVYGIKARNLESIIKSADSEERSELISEIIKRDRPSIDFEKLTKAQQYDMALELTRERINRFNVTAIVVCFVALLFMALAMYAINQSNGENYKSPQVVLRNQALLLGYDGVQALGNSIEGKSITQQIASLDERLRILSITHIKFPADPNGVDKSAAPAIRFAQKVSGALSARDANLAAAFQLGWVGHFSLNTPSLKPKTFSVIGFAQQAGFQNVPKGTDKEILEYLVKKARGEQ